MKILHIYKDYPPILGGIENHVKLLAEGQAARGHAVTALVTNPAGLHSTETMENGVQVVRAGRLATVASTPLTLALPWRLLRERPDVVHLHFPYPVGETAQWLLRRGKGTVLSYHSDVVRQASILRFYRPAHARVLQQVDAIVIGSPPMRKSAYLAPYQSKLRPDPVRHSARTVSAGPIRAGSPRPYATEQPSFTLLFVGRLRYYKGLDTLIRALPQIPARLRVVGIGPMEAEWKALAQEVGVAERIEWLGEAPTRICPACTTRPISSCCPPAIRARRSGWCRSRRWRRGLPVVCTELGTGTTYVNIDGVTGLVVPPRDPRRPCRGDQLADCRPRPPRWQWAAAPQARVQQEFALDVMVDRMLALYEEITRRETGLIR